MAFFFVDALALKQKKKTLLPFGPLAYDPAPVIDYAITETFLDSQSNVFGLHVTTNAPWPLFLANPTFVRIIPDVPYSLDAVDGTFSSTDDYNFCHLSQANSECLQKATFKVLDAVSPYCNLDGVYEVTWDVVCRAPVFPSCPFSSNTFSLNITVAPNLVCVPATITVNATSNLQSFSDPAYTTPQIVFFANDTVYFKFDYTTEGNPLSATMPFVTFTRGRTNYALVGEGIIMSGYAAAEFAFTPGDQTQFSFKLLTSDDPSALFHPSEIGTTLSFTVSVEVELDYGFIVTRKRDRVTISESHTMFLSKDF